MKNGRIMSDGGAMHKNLANEKTIPPNDVSPYDASPAKEILNIQQHSITFQQAWRTFNLQSTKRKFVDLKHSSVLEHRYYALRKLKGHGVIRINYEIREGRIRIINAFKAGAEDTERYYYGEEDF